MRGAGVRAGGWWGGISMCAYVSVFLLLARTSIPLCPCPSLPSLAAKPIRLREKRPASVIQGPTPHLSVAGRWLGSDALRVHNDDGASTMTCRYTCTHPIYRGVQAKIDMEISMLPRSEAAKLEMMAGIGRGAPNEHPHLPPPKRGGLIETQKKVVATGKLARTFRRIRLPRRAKPAPALTMSTELNV